MQKKSVPCRAFAYLLLALAALTLAPLSKADSPTLSRIARNGFIRVGYIPTPGTFAFQNSAGETVGYSIDICNRFIDNIRSALRRKDIRVQFRPLAAAERIPLLKRGEIDVECGGNTNTVARQKDVDFSLTFFNTGVRFLVKKPFQIEHPDALWRKRVAVTKGTTAEEIVARLENEQRAQKIFVKSDDEGVKLVATGQVDAFAQDDVLLYGLVAQSDPRDDLAVTGKYMTVEPYAFMLPKGDLPFRDLADQTFIQLIQSGELLRIYQKWFDTDRLRIPMNVHMKENMRFPSRYGIP